MKSTHFIKSVFSAFSLFGMSCAVAFGLTGDASAQRYYPVTTQAQAAAITGAPVQSVPADATVQTGVPADAAIPSAEAYAGVPAGYGYAPCQTCAPCCCEEAPRGLFLHNLFPTQCVNGCLGPGAFFLEGHIAQGWNFTGNDSDYLEPIGTNDHNGYQMKQLYLSFGRRVAHGDSWALGFQGDLMFGTDYYYATSTGLETDHNGRAKLNKTTDDAAYRAGHSQYGLAIPQAYLEVYCPWLLGIDVKVGHFYSVMGYEGAVSTGNFFNSRSYTSLYGMPGTMTGVMTTSRLGDHCSLILGAVNEWGAFDTPTDYFSFVAGVTLENCCRNLSLSAVVMTGKQNFGMEGREGYDTTVFDLCGKWNITPCFSYVMEFTVGHADNPFYCMETSSWKQGRNWYGFANYLFWKVREDLTLGFRFEMFSDPDDTVINGGYGMAWNNKGSTYFNWSLGANWDPFCWLTVRPEVRWDYSKWEYVGAPGSGTYDQNTRSNQFTGSVDLIVRF